MTPKNEPCDKNRKLVKIQRESERLQEMKAKLEAKELRRRQIELDRKGERVRREQNQEKRLDMFR